MKSVIIFIALLALVSGNIQVRIKNGQQAEPGQFPYIASIQQLSGDKQGHICGASIIGRRVLLTSAHCDGNKDLVVLVGTTKLDDPNGKLYKVKEFLAHEDYEVVNLVRDVALVILDEDIEFSDLIQPIPISNQEPEVDEHLTVAGWGKLTYCDKDMSNDLQWLQTIVITKELCAEHMTPSFPLEGKTCTGNANGFGICTGDSGGPLVNEEGEIVGIVSASFRCGLGRPDIFTDVFYNKEWILEHSASYL